jgi:hypothetical protein
LATRRGAVGGATDVLVVMRDTTCTLCVIGLAVARTRVAAAVLVSDRLLRPLWGDATPDMGCSVESFLPKQR